MDNAPKRQLAKFFIKSALVLLPVISAVASFVALDPFQVIWPRNDFYVNCRVEPNRDWVSMQIYMRNAAREGYNSFIFGSSRSGAFSTADWKKYFTDAAPFHFGVSQESLYGIWTKLKYLMLRDGPLSIRLWWSIGKRLSAPRTGKGIFSSSIRCCPDDRGFRFTLHFSTAISASGFFCAI